MQTDPRKDQKHAQAKSAHHPSSKKSSASKKSAAGSSHAHSDKYRDEYTGEKKAKHTQLPSRPDERRGDRPVKKSHPEKGAVMQERDMRKSRDSGEYRAGHASKHASKPARNAYDARYVQPNLPKKKKKKFKFKRFFKNLGREIAAFGAKLVEVEEHPVEQTAFAQTPGMNDFGFSQGQPLFDKPAKSSQTAKPQLPIAAKNILAKTKKVLLSGVRFVARGIYIGVRKFYAFLMKLPQRTLLIGSGAFGLVLITVVVLAIALPGKSSQADQGEQLAAFAALDSQQTALESATLDGMQPGDLTADGTLVTNTENTVDSQINAITDSSITDVTQTGPVLTGEVKAGDNGEIVTTIQKRLMELGYMDSDEPTQHFGPLTQSALKSFQRHNGLGDDGICGVVTFDMLMNEDSKVYVMQLGDTGPDVEGVQQRLYPRRREPGYQGLPDRAQEARLCHIQARRRDG